MATNILAEINALLNPHGIFVQLVLEKKTAKERKRARGPVIINPHPHQAAPHIPVGLSFSKMQTKSE